MSTPPTIEDYAWLMGQIAPKARQRALRILRYRLPWTALHWRLADAVEIVRQERGRTRRKTWEIIGDVAQAEKLTPGELERACDCDHPGARRVRDFRDLIRHLTPTEVFRGPRDSDQ